jgi:hypothetical protein
VVNRKSETSADGQAFVLSELNRIKRLSQGKVKMIETGTGDTEVVTAFIKKGENEITGRHRVLVYLVPFSGPAGHVLCLCVCLCLHLYLFVYVQARVSGPTGGILICVRVFAVCACVHVCVCVCMHEIKCVYVCILYVNAGVLGARI